MPLPLISNTGTLWRRLRRQQRGGAAVEFALSFPIMVFVTLMVFDVGRGLFVYTTLNNLAAEGVRYASLHGADSPDPATADDIVAFVDELAAGLDVEDLSVDVAYDQSNAPGEAVIVTVTYALQFYLAPFIDQDAIALSAASRMTIL